MHYNVEQSNVELGECQTFSCQLLHPEELRSFDIYLVLFQNILIWIHSFIIINGSKLKLSTL